MDVNATIIYDQNDQQGKVVMVRLLLPSSDFGVAVKQTRAGIM